MNPRSKNLSKLAEKSMRKAVLKVVDEHRKRGASLSVWKNGKVIQVSPSKLIASKKRKSTSNNSLKRNRLRRSA